MLDNNLKMAYILASDFFKTISYNKISHYALFQGFYPHA